MSKEAISARLRRVGDLSNLDCARRLDAKIDMSPSAVSQRLREAFELQRLCASLRARRPK
jgi:hypothetical protein